MLRSPETRMLNMRKLKRSTPTLKPEHQLVEN